MFNWTYLHFAADQHMDQAGGNVYQLVNQEPLSLILPLACPVRKSLTFLDLCFFLIKLGGVPLRSSHCLSQAKMHMSLTSYKGVFPIKLRVVETPASVLPGDRGD